MAPFPDSVLPAPPPLRPRARACVRVCVRLRECMHVSVCARVCVRDQDINGVALLQLTDADLRELGAGYAAAMSHRPPKRRVPI